MKCWHVKQTLQNLQTRLEKNYTICLIFGITEITSKCIAFSLRHNVHFLQIVTSGKNFTLFKYLRPYVPWDRFSFGFDYAVKIVCHSATGLDDRQYRPREHREHFSGPWENIQGQNSQNFLHIFLIFFVTLDLKILIL